MFSTGLTTAIAVGRRTAWRGWPRTRSRTQRRSRSRPALLTERIAEPFPLLGIDLRPRRVAAIHDHRPVLVWGRLVVVLVVRPLAAPAVRPRRGQQVLAEHAFLRVFPRGGEAGDLGEVAFTVLVVTGQMVGEFIDPLGDHFAEHGEERAGISDLLVDLWEAAFPLPYKFAVVVQRAVAAAGRIRSRQVWVPGHNDRPPRTAGAVVLRTAGVASRRSTGTPCLPPTGAGRRISLESRKHIG